MALWWIELFCTFGFGIELFCTLLFCGFGIGVAVVWIEHMVFFCCHDTHELEFQGYELWWVVMVVVVKPEERERKKNELEFQGYFGHFII